MTLSLKLLGSPELAEEQLMNLIKALVLMVTAQQKEDQAPVAAEIHKQAKHESC